MSSRAIRTWFRQRVASALPSLPYIETVNVAPNPKNLPDLWVTLEFNNASEQRLTIGTNAVFREYGLVNIVVLGLSGKGDTAVLDAAELVRPAFTRIAVSLPVGAEFGDLRIDAPDPPNTDQTESGNWFLGSVSCSYTFDVVRS